MRLFGQFSWRWSISATREQGKGGGQGKDTACPTQRGGGGLLGQQKALCVFDCLKTQWFELVILIIMKNTQDVNSSYFWVTKLVFYLIVGCPPLLFSKTPLPSSLETIYV